VGSGSPRPLSANRTQTGELSENGLRDIFSHRILRGSKPVTLLLNAHLYLLPTRFPLGIADELSSFRMVNAQLRQCSGGARKNCATSNNPPERETPEIKKMMNKQSLITFRTLSNQALALHRQFQKYFWTVDLGKLAGSPSFQLVLREQKGEPFLVRLILQGIQQLICFELLIRTDPETAAHLFVAIFLNEEADPDNQPGGFSFELSFVLQRLFDEYGSDALSYLVQQPHVTEQRLIHDQRVRSSFAQVLGIRSAKQTRIWIQEHRNSTSRMDEPFTSPLEGANRSVESHPTARTEPSPKHVPNGIDKLAQESTEKTFFTLADNTLKNRQEFGSFWDAIDPNELGQQLTTDDVETLSQLVTSRIFLLPAFELLVRRFPRKACSLLVDRFLGEHVDPDYKYGGSGTTISVALSDMVEHDGPQALVHLLKVANLEMDQLTADDRILRGFGEALELNSYEEIEQWLRKHRHSLP
jgi:hypothetical protein